MFWRLLKTAFFTLVAPGTVGVLVPQMLRGTQADSPVVLRGLGVLLFLSGAAIYLSCAWEFVSKGLGTPAPIDAPGRLVVKGLYRYTRNPMYVGVAALILGQAAYYASGAMVAYCGAVVLAFRLFIRFYEEPTLRRLFGESYEEYCRRVPRWIRGAPRT